MRGFRVGSFVAAWRIGGPGYRTLPDTRSVAGEFDIFRLNKKTKKNLFKKYSLSVVERAENQENV